MMRDSEGDTNAERRRCCFAEAVGGRSMGCTQASRATQQYRRTVYCRSREAHGVCAAWLDQVRRASRFTLGAKRSPAALPRRAAARIQRGALLGMRDLLDDQASDRIRDVSDLLRRALARFGSFDQVPMGSVVHRVHAADEDGGQRR